MGEQHLARGECSINASFVITSAQPWTPALPAGWERWLRVHSCYLPLAQEFPDYRDSLPFILRLIQTQALDTLKMEFDQPSLVTVWAHVEETEAACGLDLQRSPQFFHGLSKS